MGRKLSFAGKITAMLLSLVLIINSVGLTVLASDVTSLDGSRKVGEKYAWAMWENAPRLSPVLP